MRTVLILGLLLAAGAVGNGIARAHARPSPAPASALEKLWSGTGALRPVLADAFWLRAHFAWESADEPAVRAWLQLAVSAEPEHAYFRFNAARMIAFDFPAWRARREPDAPAAVQEKWRRECGDEALALLALDEGAPEAARWIEAGNIALYGQRDLARAADYFRRAARCADAPWHAGRIGAELLRANGRPAEAAAWLREWLPRLPPDVPEAQRALVEARLAELEREVGGTEPF